MGKEVSMIHPAILQQLIARHLMAQNPYGASPYGQQLPPQQGSGLGMMPQMVNPQMGLGRMPGTAGMQSLR